MEKRIYNVPFYELLTEEERELLINNCTIVDFDSREAIFKQGSFALNSYIILDGSCKLTFQSGDKKRLTSILHKGQMIGKDYALFDNYPCSAHTLAKSTLMIIPKTLLSEICKTNSLFYIKLANRLELRMINSLTWLVTLSFKNVEGALAMFLLKYYNDEKYEGIELTRTEIAEAIGYSRESIIHTLKKFVKEKLIETKGKNILIKNHNKLKEIIKYS